MASTNEPLASRDLTFVRHGATAPNLAEMRCGGDFDVALTEIGRHQAGIVAQRIRALRIPVGLIVTSNLRRTRETAEIIGRLLPGIELMVEPAFAERRLGAWNMRPIADTQAELAAGVTPPGGESNEEFSERIARAVERLLARLEQRPLLVGSKGVARVLCELLGLCDRRGIANGEAVHFDFSAFTGRGACQA
jgi:probable phosphoglycerate mutase